MAITLLDQETQIRSSFPVATNYDDNVVVSEANFETSPVNLNDDLNNLRSQVSNLMDGQAGEWWTDLNVPSTLDTGAARGVNDLNTALHAVEKKRVLRCYWGLDSIAGGAGQAVTLGASELPGNLLAAVGAGTTLGTVVAAATLFGTASASDLVAGTTVINPKNLVQIVDATSRDPILDAGDQVYGLLQTETVTDGHTMSAVTATRVQISFVKVSAGALVLITAGAMNSNFDYCYVERVRLEDLNEADFLGGASVDVPAGTTVTRQVSYDNQGATPVDVITNSILDLEGPGLSWEVRDDLQATLLKILEGSAGGTSEVQVAADVDVLNVDAIANDFAAGATLNSGGVRPITVGVTDGILASTAGDLGVTAFAELLLDDANQTGSTWAQTTGIKLSETTAEWDAFETAFGEVSLLNAIVAAKNTSGRRKLHSIVTAAGVIAADTDVSGPSNDNNLDTDLGDLSAGVFVDDYDIFLNGDLQVNGVNAAANKDVYPGTALASGQLKFEKKLKNGNVISLIDWVS